MLDEANKIHAHLDECEQCREHPFAMCPTGQRLLQEAGVALGALPPPKRERGDRRRSRRKKGKRR